MPDDLGHARMPDPTARILVLLLGLVGLVVGWNWSGSESPEIVSHEVLSGDSQYDQRTLFVYNTGEKYVVEWFVGRHSSYQRVYEYDSGRELSRGGGWSEYQGVRSDWNTYNRGVKEAERRSEWHGEQP